MGRKRKDRSLDVYIGSRKVGRYARAANGATSFRYDTAWLSFDRAFPISLSMPLSDRIWSGESATGYFDGLLPDDPAVREKIAAREEADSSGVFDLLAVIGRDCVGALRFVPEGSDPGDPSKMEYRPVTDEDIANRLASLGTAPLGLGIGSDDFRISIAGVQEKTAFLRIGDQWHIPHGSTPTSHIFKPAIKAGPDGADFSDTPWNEWLCLHLCAALGLETARSDVLMFGGSPVIVVERFDRTWRDGVLYRIPQEDLCQALGVPPSRKYQSDGGPGMADMLEFLKGSDDPPYDQLIFLKAQIVFWLLAAIDGHAKNFSIFLTPGGFTLTPLYDIMSAAPYPQLSDHKVILAMAIGDSRHYRVRDILPRHFYQTGKQAGLSDEDVAEIMTELTGQIDAAVESVSELAKKTGAPQATVVPILEGVKKRAGLLV